MLIERLRRVGWPLAPVLCVAFAATSLPPRVVRAQEAPAPPAGDGGGAEATPAGALPGDGEGALPGGGDGTGEGAAPEAQRRRPGGAVANARRDTDEPAEPADGEGEGDPGGDEAGVEELPGIDRDLVRQNAALPTGADKSGVTSQTISMPQGAGKIAGMGESFSAQLSTGIATFSVPFALPAARGGAQPSLGLSYSSSGGNGVAGQGWSVGVPFIARQTDRGLPTYDDQASWHSNQDRFVFNGGQELVPICTVAEDASGGGGGGTGGAGGGATLGCVAGSGSGSGSGSVGSGAIDAEVFPAWSAGWQYFRPRVEGSFLRFFWSPDHRTWRVQDQSGVSMELGVPLDGSGYDAALDVNPDRASEIYRWHLVRQYDTFGDTHSATGAATPHNVVVYRYFQDGGMAYLSDIFDTTPAANPTDYSRGSFAHRTQLFYATRPDVTVSYRSGWRIQQRLLLAQVAVSSQTETASERKLVRRYHLAYDEASHRSLLETVTVEGRCAEDEGSAEPEPSDRVDGPECGTLPPMTFAYTHVPGFDPAGNPQAATLPGYEAFDGRVRTIAQSPPHSLDEELSSLFDINSDGLPDVLVTAPGIYGDGHGYFRNGPGGAGDTFGAAKIMGVEGVLGANATTIKLNNLNVAPLDLDGDATIDLLHMPRVKTYAVYTPVERAARSDEWDWVGRAVTTASDQDPKIDFGNDTLDVKVLDANGDGLVDVVVSTGTELQTFFSLGRFRGGDGQFGHAQWRSALVADLSNDPVTSCVPWSAQPVRFSDPDVKLADLNGDGLVDIVRLRRGDIIYWPGRGNGYWGTGDRDDCAGSAFGEGRHVRMNDAPQYSDIQGTTLRMDDVNGDGLDDLVQVRFDAVDVWLNVNGTGWTERHILDGTPPSPSYANRVRLVDVNGSGTRDILWGDAENYRYIDLQGGQQPHLLSEVNNGLGKTTTIEYSTSTAQMLAAEAAGKPWKRVMPNVTQVVERVTEFANLQNAPPVVTEYRYADPVFEGRQREFRGFERASATRLGDANSPTDVTETTFLLGECLDPTAATAGGAGAPTTTSGAGATGYCGPAYRALDNPYEALKGLPVVTEQRDEQGTYLSTAATSYELRELYVGQDGRRVMHAVQTGSRSWAYDTGPFVPASDAPTRVEQPVTLRRLTGAAADDNPLVPSAEGALPVAVERTRRSHRYARTESRSVVDAFGNQTHAIAAGCTGGSVCAGPDPVITSVTEPGRVPDDASGWMFRTVASCVVEGEFGGWCDEAAAPHEARNYSLVTYNAHGQPIATEAVLRDTLPLVRTDGTGAPAASGDGTFVVSQSSYDPDLGHPRRSWGVDGRCSDVTFDPDYATLPVTETIYTGGCASAQPTDAPQGRALTTRVETYDRGLGLIVQARDLQDQPTRVTYDEFGRLTAMYAPHPHQPGALWPHASVRVSYDLATATRPWSIIHTRTEDSPIDPAAPQAVPADATYLQSYALVDGFGRTLTTMTEADPGAGHDQGAWVVGGLLLYDAKSAVQRKYLEYFSDEHPLDYTLTVPLTPYGSQRYDAFGRQVQTYDIDGTVTLQSVYHALSTDLYDAADLQPGPHQGSYASTRSDGHGRTVRTTERIHVNGALQARHVDTRYLSTGEPAQITRVDGSGQGAPVVRWMRYDSLGRMVLNVEPNTSAGDLAPGADPSAVSAWRYAYNRAGDLVGTSDARGCGIDFAYDGAGRLLSEDYHGCAAHHPAYDVEPEVAYQYDELPTSTDPALAWMLPPHDGGALRGTWYDYRPTGPRAALLEGRLVATYDRASASFTQYDGRGRVVRVATRVARPEAHLTTPTPQRITAFQGRYAPRYYERGFTFDAADREVVADTGAQGYLLMAQDAQGDDVSQVHTAYTARGTVKSVSSSYSNQPLVAAIHRSADGLLGKVQYGDLAGTTTENRYDERRRLRNVITYRGPPGAWDTAAGYLIRPPTQDQSDPSSFQLLLQDEDFAYDVVGNPTEITDWRIPEEWPDGAKPVTKKIQYDDLYRVARIDHEYAEGDDTWHSPFERELNEPSDQRDPRRADPSPHVSFTHRVKTQTYRYDWLGNTQQTTDDAQGFYDRSLGEIENDTAGGKPYQLRSAEIATSRPPETNRDGRVDTQYDVTGNLTRMELRRAGPCLGGTCSQRFAYEWDEVLMAELTSQAPPNLTSHDLGPSPALPP